MSSLEAFADLRDLTGYEAFAALDQAVLEAIPAAVYVVSAQGTVMRFNRRMIELWGRSPRPDESDGRLWAGDRFFEANGTPLAQSLTPMEAALRTGRRQSDREMLIEMPNGSRHFVAVDVEPLKDARGVTRGTINFFRDATGRKRAAERQARDLLDALPAAVYTTDTAGRLTYYNRAAVELWGYSPKLGDTRWCGSWKLYWPDGTALPHDECPMATALKEGRPVRGVEAVAERPDGTRVAFLPYPTPIFDAAGELTGAVNMLADLSATKRSEYTNALLASIIESSDDAIVSKDLDGTVLSWNKGAERIFGYSAAEAIGRPITFIFPPDRLAEEPDILSRIRRGDRIDHYETVRRRKDGSLIDVSLTISAMRDAGGKIVGASKIARDITDRKRAEEQRNLLVAELSHRVKNTLATVTSIARLSFAKNADIAAASRAFDARIRALAQSHGRLAEANWLGVSFDSILRDEFAPYRRPDGANVRISGPPILLNPQSALMLGMVVHELATNAAKHGALSVASGAVDVAWRIDAADRQVRIDWTESGGPPVAPPVRTGFGCILLERALAADLDSDVTLDFARDGFRCAIAIPVARTFHAAAAGAGTA